MPRKTATCNPAPKRCSIKGEDKAYDVDDKRIIEEEKIKRDYKTESTKGIRKKSRASKNKFKKLRIGYREIEYYVRVVRAVEERALIRKLRKEKRRERALIGKEKQVSQESVSQESVCREPVSQESVGHESVGHESVGHESVCREPVCQESVSQESLGQEPAPPARKKTPMFRYIGCRKIEHYVRAVGPFERRALIRKLRKEKLIRRILAIRRKRQANAKEPEEPSLKFSKATSKPISKCVEDPQRKECGPKIEYFEIVPTSERIRLPKDEGDEDLHDGYMMTVVCVPCSPPAKIDLRKEKERVQKRKAEAARAKRKADNEDLFK